MSTTLYAGIKLAQSALTIISALVDKSPSDITHEEENVIVVPANIYAAITSVGGTIRAVQQRKPATRAGIMQTAKEVERFVRLLMSNGSLNHILDDEGAVTIDADALGLKVSALPSENLNNTVIQAVMHEELAAPIRSYLFQGQTLDVMTLFRVLVILVRLFKLRIPGVSIVGDETTGQFTLVFAKYVNGGEKR